MEKGDLDVLAADRRIVVLEDVCCTPVLAPRKLFRAAYWVPPEQWGWQNGALKSIQDWRHRLSIVVEIVTFLDSNVADAAAEWLDEYDVTVDGVSYVDYNWFCRSLTWRPDVSAVVDTNQDRASNYGQKGYITIFGGVF